LPGLISADLLVETRKNEPFLKDKIKVGYFGGLSEEKGAKLILELYTILPTNFEFIITGTGELESEYLSLAKKSEGRFQYYGRVGDKQLYNLIASTDVILNPHKPISEMTNGVFPFKVTEAIASGRLVISTPLMDKDFNQILDAVSFIDYDLKQWASVLINSKQIYEEKQDDIKKCTEEVIKLFSEDSVRTLIRIQIAS
jgi:glycosyltransferase involved in cell wall biosynthesis